ncbi:hypothetical protein LTR85_006422 [Meristemomyces frigidus]|nr:hypothetical protein LTR85_006422 [Meristemomyces frigidus]
MRTTTVIFAALSTGIAFAKNIQPPTCDATDHRAVALFATADRARQCVAALVQYEADIYATEGRYVDFIVETQEYERRYNKLCRWQHLVDEVPVMSCEHEEAFGPVRKALQRVVEAETVVWSWYGLVRRVCAGIGRT